VVEARDQAVRWAPMSAFPSPDIRSARLDLREYGAGDDGLVRGLLAGAEPEALPPGAPSDPADVAGWLADGAQRSRREGTGVHLMMLDRAAGRIVGSIGLFHADWEVRSVEIGYGVSGRERGKGYASEALAAVARWTLTEGGIQRAWLTANTDNVASVRVAEKAGFRREGTLRRAALEADGLHDQAVFSLLDDEL
jgi:RimJ/RimL family protein N-acetyltransferase